MSETTDYEKQSGGISPNLKIIAALFVGLIFGAWANDEFDDDDKFDLNGMAFPDGLPEPLGSNQCFGTIFESSLLRGRRYIDVTMEHPEQCSLLLDVL